MITFTIAVVFSNKFSVESVLRKIRGSDQSRHIHEVIMVNKVESHNSSPRVSYLLTILFVLSSFYSEIMMSFNSRNHQCVDIIVNYLELMH